jgi:hypothetical protein
MDIIIASRLLTASEVRRLNYCRLYLQAVTLSDITTTNGLTLNNSKLHGCPSLQSSGTRWVSINQDKPSDREWRLWQKANLLWANAQSTLHHPLMSWILPIHEQRFQHFAYQSQNTLWTRLGDASTYEGHHIVSTRAGSAATLQRSFTNLPRHACPVEVTLGDHNIWYQVFTPSQLSITSSIPRPMSHASFESYISSLEAWEAELLHHTELFVDPNLLCLEGQTRFRAVSDGSVFPNVSASFGWILSTNEGERVTQNMGPVRGYQIHSYRAEASGVLSVLRFLLRIAEFTQMHEKWNGVVATDGQSLLDTLEGVDNVRRRKMENLST